MATNVTNNLPAQTETEVAGDCIYCRAAVLKNFAPVASVALKLKDGARAWGHRPCFEAKKDALTMQQRRAIRDEQHVISKRDGWKTTEAGLAVIARELRDLRNAGQGESDAALDLEAEERNLGRTLGVHITPAVSWDTTRELNARAAAGR